MAAPTRVAQYGDQMLVIMDDGTRHLAYPTTGGLWIVGGGGGTPPGDSRFIWPFDPRPYPEGTVRQDGSEWGDRSEWGFPFHNGIDFTVPGGSPIPAMGDGVVVVAQVWDGVSEDGMQALGNYYRIDHGMVAGVNLLTGYAHLEMPPWFGVGYNVTQGEILGGVGTTGFSTGDHLHLETWVNGDRPNPRDWMATYANA